MTRSRWLLPALTLLCLFAIAGWARVREPTPSAYFHPAIAIATTPASHALLEDVNGNGSLDLVVPRLSERMVLVRLGNGRGEFVEEGYPRVALDCDPTTSQVWELTGDRRPDLLVACRVGGEEHVRLWAQGTNGTFAKVHDVAFVLGSSERSYKPMMRTSDLNRDGVPDLVYMNGREGVVYAALGLGGGRFATPIAVPTEKARFNYTFEVSDMNGDGTPDLVVATGMVADADTPGHLSIHLGDGSGHFAPPQLMTTRLLPDPQLALATDVDGDADVDLVVMHGRSPTLSILLNDGRGGLADPTSVALTDPASAVVAHDVDHDRRLDLVALAANGRRAPHAARLNVLIGVGGGRFTTDSAPVPVYHESYRLVAGDIDRDGRLDLLVRSLAVDSLLWLRGR